MVKYRGNKEFYTKYGAEGCGDIVVFLNWSRGILPHLRGARGFIDDRKVKFTDEFKYPVRYLIDGISVYAYNYREFDDDLQNAFDVGCAFTFLEEDAEVTADKNGYGSEVSSVFRQLGVVDINNFLDHCCGILPKVPSSWKLKGIYSLRPDLVSCSCVHYPIAVKVEDEMCICKNKAQLSALLLETYTDNVPVSIDYYKKR